MKSIIKQTTLAAAIASLAVLTGCTTTSDSDSSGSSITNADSNAGSNIADLDRRTRELDKREAAFNARSSSSSMTGSAGGLEGDLLPPNASAGECYARVWVDAQYRTTAEQFLTSEASSTITVIPAKYTTVTESVLVSAASSTLETIPAVYGTESETMKVRDGQQLWRVGLNRKDAPANNALLAAAVAHGINLDSAQPGMCFHEHYTPKTYRTISDQVVTRTATEEVTIIPARYEMVQKSVLISEASTRLETIPAKYETVREEILDKPAHTVWKKGAGPIQRIDQATGEIMCLVEVPATYKTITRTVLKSPASTRTVEIPAEYRNVEVRQLVSAASESRTPVPEVYGTVDRTVVDQEGGFVWHEISNNDHPAATRTGNKVCLTETQPEYRTVERTVVKTPAQTRTIEIPAKYRDVKVTKLVSAASEQTTVIPAAYRTVDKSELVKDGYMAWRSILCDTNMTKSRIADIQRALVTAGYDIGTGGVDGVIGRETISAVNAFQTANNLPVDKYLNIATVEALGVSTK